MDERSGETDALVCRDRIAITAVIATHNEEQHIGHCLLALLKQRDLPGPLEILVIDGMSTDHTVDIVRSFPQYGTSIRLIHNPRKLQVFAWNIALQEMQGEYFAMMTAHADYADDYFARCVEVLERTGAAAVGGVPAAAGQGFVGRAVAWCMSTPFGVGGARFRYLKKEETCDTVPLIFARQETIAAIGGWDERISFDEDSDLAYRLRGQGGRLVVSPRIGVRYYVRESFKSLSMQMYRYGYWRRFTQMKHPRSVPLRVMAPAALVCGLALSAALVMTPLRPLSAIVPLTYGTFLAAAAILAVGKTGLPGLAVPAALACMHTSYGVGYWRALIRTRSLDDTRGRSLAR